MDVLFLSCLLLACCTSTVAGVTCPQGVGDQSTVHDGLCYILFRQESPWIDAENICRQHGGYLIRTSNPGHITVAMDTMDAASIDELWIGVREEVTFLWEDGSTLTEAQSRLTDPAPPRARDGNYCVAMDTMRDFVWSLRMCTSLATSVCEVGTTDLACSPSNHSNLLTVEGRCFLYERTLQSKLDAARWCSSLDGLLAKVDVQLVQDALKALIQSLPDIPESVWIGLERNPWKWSTGDKVEVYFWDTQQPQGEGQCVTLRRANNASWANAACQDAKSFICQIGEDDAPKPALSPALVAPLGDAPTPATPTAPRPPSDVTKPPADVTPSPAQATEPVVGGDTKPKDDGGPSVELIGGLSAVAVVLILLVAGIVALYFCFFRKAKRMRSRHRQESLARGDDVNGNVSRHGNVPNQGNQRHHDDQPNRSVFANFITTETRSGEGHVETTGMARVDQFTRIKYENEMECMDSPPTNALEQNDTHKRQGDSVPCRDNGEPHESPKAKKHKSHEKPFKRGEELAEEKRKRGDADSLTARRRSSSLRNNSATAASFRQRRASGNIENQSEAGRRAGSPSGSPSLRQRRASVDNSRLLKREQKRQDSSERAPTGKSPAARRNSMRGEVGDNRGKVAQMVADERRRIHARPPKEGSRDRRDPSAQAPEDYLVPDPKDSSDTDTEWETTHGSVTHRSPDGSPLRGSRDEVALWGTKPDLIHSQFDPGLTSAGCGRPGRPDHDDLVMISASADFDKALQAREMPEADALCSIPQDRLAALNAETSKPETDPRTNLQGHPLVNYDVILHGGGHSATNTQKSTAGETSSKSTVLTGLSGGPRNDFVGKLPPIDLRGKKKFERVDDFNFERNPGAGGDGRSMGGRVQVRERSISLSGTCPEGLLRESFAKGEGSHEVDPFDKSLAPKRRVRSASLDRSRQREREGQEAKVNHSAKGHQKHGKSNKKLPLVDDDLGSGEGRRRRKWDKDISADGAKHQNRSQLSTSGGDRDVPHDETDARRDHSRSRGMGPSPHLDRGLKQSQSLRGAKGSSNTLAQKDRNLRETNFTPPAGKGKTESKNRGEEKSLRVLQRTASLSRLDKRRDSGAARWDASQTQTLDAIGDTGSRNRGHRLVFAHPGNDEASRRKAHLKHKEERAKKEEKGYEKEKTGTDRVQDKHSRDAKRADRKSQGHDGDMDDKEKRRIHEKQDHKKEIDKPSKHHSDPKSRTAHRSEGVKNGDLHAQEYDSDGKKHASSHQGKYRKKHKPPHHKDKQSEDKRRKKEAHRRHKEGSADLPSAEELDSSAHSSGLQRSMRDVSSGNMAFEKSHGSKIHGAKHNIERDIVLDSFDVGSIDV